MKQYFKDPQIEYIGESGGAIHDVNGLLLVFEPYDKNAEYFIGGDVGGGLGLSNSVAHVLKAGTLHTPDIQVAEWASNMHSPTEFAHVLNCLGNAYWNHEMDLPATLNIEQNNYGHTTIAILVEQLDYLNLYQNIDMTRVTQRGAPQWGMNVTDKTRVPLVMLGESRLKSGQWEVWSPFFIQEMADFQITNIRHTDALNKEILADQGKAEGKMLDDRLFAGFHALWACNTMNPEVVLERERKRLRHIQEEKAKDEVPGPRRTWRNSQYTYDQMMQEQDQMG
jgi:hypothetical protein